MPVLSQILNGSSGLDSRDTINNVLNGGLNTSLGIWKTIGHSAVPISLTGTTTATLLATIAVPANSMGPNGIVRVRGHWSMTNNANSKNMAIRWGLANTNLFSGGFASQASLRADVEVQNRNGTGSQLIPAVSTSASFGFLGAVTADSQDTTIAQRIQFVGTLSNAGDTMTLESFTVDLWYGA